MQAKLREIQAAFTGKDDDKAEIFSAHLDMVDDEEISEEIRSAIHAGTGAAKAVEQVYQRYADLLDMVQPEIKVLVNCAGFGKFGRYDQIPWMCSRGFCASYLVPWNRIFPGWMAR